MTPPPRPEADSASDFTAQYTAPAWYRQGTPPPRPEAVSASDFTPQYTPPAWYRQGTPPQGWNSADAVPWHSVNPSQPALPACAVCGGTPAEMFSIRAHQGFILVMRWTRLDKTLCAVCGTALIRNMTTRTLWQGWWGVGSLLVGTPLTLVSNLRTYRRLRHLPVAAPAPGRVQLQLGRPILQRPLAYVALLPFGWALWLLINGLAG